MEVKSFTPLNPLLRDYIECFYTLTRRPEEKDNVSNFALPNVFTILSITRILKPEN